MHRAPERDVCANDITGSYPKDLVYAYEWRVRKMPTHDSLAGCAREINVRLYVPKIDLMPSLLIRRSQLGPV